MLRRGASLPDVEACGVTGCYNLGDYPLQNQSFLNPRQQRCLAATFPSMEPQGEPKS